MDSMDATRVDQWHYLCGRKEADQTFNGALDDVVTFSRPIDSEEITLLFHGPNEKLRTALEHPTIIVEAGANQQHALPANRASLEGKIQNSESGVSYQRSVVKGEGEVSFSDPDKTIVAAYEEVGKSLPLDVFCKETGYLPTRSSWNEDGTHLVFRCRMDKYFLGHQHRDVNSFELWSHQRHWFIDPGKVKIENDRHATVLIDGIGGGGSLNWWTWPSMPGKFLKFEQSNQHTLGLGDAKNFYTYSVHPSKSPNGFVPDALKKRLGLSTEPFSDHGLKWTDFVYPGTDLDALPAWRHASLSADFAYRSNSNKPVYLFNPVAKALRPAALYRNGPAFFVISDDIQKDDQKHDYSWVANMPVDAIEVLHATDGSLILKHKEDSAESGPRLFVKLLGVEGDTNVSLENFVIKSSQAHVTRLRIEANETVNPKF